MSDITRRGVGRLIGVAVSSMAPYRLSASVTLGALAAGSVPPDVGWQQLNLKSARYVTLAAIINGSPVQAVIDTGASRSVINADLARRLALPLSGTLEAAAFTKNVVGALYKVRELKLGNAILRNADIASFDLSKFEGSIVQQLPLLIGQDILADTVLEIQFPRDRARLIDKPGPELARSQKLPVTLGASHLPLIPVRLGSRAATPAIFDLGSNVVCTVSEAFAAHYELTAGRRTSTTLTTGVEGESVSTIFCLSEISLGSFILRDVPVCIVKDWKFSTPVNIGWSFFAAFNLVINMRDRNIMLNADSEILEAPFPKDRSGIGAARLNDRIVVRHVAENSPAQRSGLKPGDEIVALDGRPIDSTYPAPGERQGMKAAGTQMSMMLSDGREVTLVLADYF